jgi:hypothetical protein
MLNCLLSDCTGKFCFNQWPYQETDNKIPIESIDYRIFLSIMRALSIQKSSENEKNDCALCSENKKNSKSFTYLCTQ